MEFAIQVGPPELVQKVLRLGHYIYVCTSKQFQQKLSKQWCSTSHVTQQNINTQKQFNLSSYLISSKFQTTALSSIDSRWLCFVLYSIICWASQSEHGIKLSSTYMWIVGNEILLLSTPLSFGAIPWCSIRSELSLYCFCSAEICCTSSCQYILTTKCRCWIKFSSRSSVQCARR